MEEPVLRSINNIHSSFVRFINKTRHVVGVYWIDYQGKAVLYKSLEYLHSLDVNTFVTHPWIFICEETGYRFNVNGSDVFYPEPWFAKYRGMRRADLPTKVERTHVIITNPMLSLRDMSLRAVKRLLVDDRHVSALNLPQSLKAELQSMPPRKSNQGQRDEPREQAHRPRIRDASP